MVGAGGAAGASSFPVQFIHQFDCHKNSKRHDNKIEHVLNEYAVMHDDRRDVTTGIRSVTANCLKSIPPMSKPSGGMIISATNDDTILPNAAPMMTPTAKSTTFPRIANSRNSFKNSFYSP